MHCVLTNAAAVCLKAGAQQSKRVDPLTLRMMLLMCMTRDRRPAYVTPSKCIRYFLHMAAQVREEDTCQRCHAGISMAPAGAWAEAGGLPMAQRCATSCRKAGESSKVLPKVAMQCSKAVAPRWALVGDVSPSVVPTSAHGLSNESLR